MARLIQELLLDSAHRTPGAPALHYPSSALDYNATSLPGHHPSGEVLV
jgi:hypothetical protein